MSEPTGLHARPPAIDRAAAPARRPRGSGMGWALLSDYRAELAAMMLIPPAQYTERQRGLLMLVLNVVSEELSPELPPAFTGVTPPEAQPTPPPVRFH